ncbi:hypothetical protein F5141DRAFT_1216808 [Pisolithus sp. B1]|nr:hypothetical protein F5141DRAFT_1216808 [Pisolithus sp. B1]
MVFQEGHFNSLLPLLPEQANSHCKTAKNCYDKWESLKREYYTASAIAGGSGLAYSVEKGTNTVTEAGQLVMEELIETHLEAAQFCSKGLKYLEHMQRFVPTDKARGTNAHHATGAQNSSTFLVPPIISPHPAVVQPAMQIHPSQYQPMAMQPPSELTFVPYQPGTLGQVAVMQTTQDIFTSPTNSSPLSIPVSPLSSTMMSLSTSLNLSSSISSHGQKCKTDATAGLDSQSTVASSMVTSSGTSSSQKQRTQVPLENTMQSFVDDMKDSTDKTLTAIGNDKRMQELNEAFALIANLEKNLSEANLVRLQMLLKEKPSFIAGYKNATTKSTTY